MLYVPLTRSAPDPVYSNTFYLNIDQSLSISRSLDNTHTRIRGTSVYTPIPPTSTRTTDPSAQLAPGEESVIEVLVIETPEQIASLIEAARRTSSGRFLRAGGTRIIGSPVTSPARPQ